ncbi:MAG: hypothetical protein JNM27_18615 [Leptospirales bacterium]|nr:hypothetical protein [Leptospirales bacterium]
MKNPELIDLRKNSKHFPVLSQWEPDRLTEVLVAMVEADKKEVTKETLFAYAAILESDLESSFGITTDSVQTRSRKKKQNAALPDRERRGSESKDWHELPLDLRDQLLSMEVTTDNDRMEDWNNKNKEGLDPTE